MNLSGTEYYYIRNAQNDIIVLFDANGNQVVTYTYDTWGKLSETLPDDPNKDGITGALADSVGKMNPYRYRGYRYDSETKLYYGQKISFGYDSSDRVKEKKYNGTQ